MTNANTAAVEDAVVTWTGDEEATVTWYAVTAPDDEREVPAQVATFRVTYLGCDRPGHGSLHFGCELATGAVPAAALPELVEYVLRATWHDACPVGPR